MNKRRFVIEMGTGVEQHGQEITKAAIKAVKDAISRVCLIGLIETLKGGNPYDMLLDVLIACPHPEEVNTDEVARAFPFGRKEIRVVEGVMVIRGHHAPSMGDRTDEIIVANAAVTVYVDLDAVSLDK
jgi:uncharacterized protein (TIGR02058 family)